MRVFRSIVETFVLPMLHARQNLPFGRCVACQLVGDDDSRYVLQSFEQLAEELLGGSLITSALHQDIKDVAMLIDRSPEVVPLAIDSEKHLVQVPLIATARATTAQFIDVGLTELQAPLAHGFVGEHDASLGHELFDVAKTEGEAKIEPDTMTDDLGWEAIAFVAGSRNVCFHEVILPQCLAFCIGSLSKLTIPSSAMVLGSKFSHMLIVYKARQSYLRDMLPPDIEMIQEARCPCRTGKQMKIAYFVHKR
jgi:hypothetical protein